MSTPDLPPNPRYRVPAPIRASFKTLSTVIPGPTARLAWHIFARPPRKPRPDRYGVMDTARRLRLQAEGHELAAWEWGEGPTVLLLHGWGSSATSLSGFVTPLAGAGFRVVAYDAYAHGTSPGVTTSGPEMARHLVEIADATRARHVVGHSMGTVVTGFAVKGGLDVERMALLNGPADMPHFLDLFAGALGLTREVQRRMIERFEREHDVRWEDCVVEWVAQDSRAPALLIHDVGDPDVPWHHAERVRQAWPNHTAITTRGLGHRGGLHSPEVVAATVSFLRGEVDQLPEEVHAKGQPERDPTS